MIRLFDGMIIEAVMAILAADGPHTADLIINNAKNLVEGFPRFF